ncbi:hypothetical protein SDNOR2018_01749 [Streptococcus dysgalactiae]
MKRENKEKLILPTGLGKPFFRMILFYDKNLKLSLNLFLDALYVKSF